MTSRTLARGPALVSTTGRSLRQRLIRLRVLSGIVLLAGTVMLAGAYRTADRMDTQAVRAVTAVADARLALVEANAAAIAALGAPTSRLTGPGQEYLGKITLASQSLEQVAEVNAAGAQGSQTLQLLGSMIGTYSGLIEKANASYAGDNALLGTSQTWNASDFLHAGMLVELDQLDRQQRAALAGADTSFWTSSWTLLFWLIPALALLALLVDTQLFLNRRFRRRLNPALALATLLVLAGVTAAPVLAGTVNHRLSQGVKELNQVREDRASQSRQQDATGQQALYELLKDACPDQAASCGATVTGVRPAAAVSPPAGESSSASGPADRLHSAAATGRALMIALATGTVLVLLLIPAGIRQRSSEYDYQA